MTETIHKSTLAPDTDDRFSVALRGREVGVETRCAHYGDHRDVIAIRFPCCDVFYPCYRCHRETADHDPERWPANRRSEHAVLCGRCRQTMSIAAYLEADHTCPACGAPFNPGCRSHWHRYFAVAE